ncbi:FAD:protein FMN transferase [Streptococcus phocae]|uniref:FAD:protein FMN transferase n=1 Tax=Streptococcus phocae TaxID=119224 RepID=A0A0P6S4W7_9STRE|nr:FAD:protein FMN transferase [Streptococcus phocae]KPJ23161.1 thiamine biosynthesis protein ApbE [Streptococcus phocae]
MKYLNYLLVSMLCLVLYGCHHTSRNTSLEVTNQPLVRSESLLHTVVQLSIYHKHQEKTMEQAISYIKEMEQLLSTNLKGSDVYRINKSAGKKAVTVDPRTFKIIKEAQKISRASHGKFDITIGAITNLWRIGDKEARRPDDLSIQQALPHIDFRKIHLDKKKSTVLIEKGMTLELGGISKGFIADEVKQIFLKNKINTAIINLGGNVVVLGTSPNHKEGWNVGVQNPDDVRGDTVGTVRLKNQSIVTSGIYERYLEVDGIKYHHIMDPKTGYPVDNNISGVTVFSRTSLEGDALSTAVFSLGIEEGLAYINQMDHVEAVFIDKNKGVHLSNGLKNTFHLTHKEYHITNET